VLNTLFYAMLSCLTLLGLAMTLRLSMRRINLIRPEVVNRVRVVTG
jgi:hypothetical protein